MNQAENSQEQPLYLSQIRFCAEECERQRSGEMSVWWMARGFSYALEHLERPPVYVDVINLGELIEPVLNAGGTRKVGVRVGWDVKMDWDKVEPSLRKLMRNLDTQTPEEFFQEYETIHPFRDGNGRTGAILYNWLRGALNKPLTAPEYIVKTGTPRSTARSQIDRA